jgi:hypothetical protein
MSGRLRSALPRLGQNLTLYGHTDRIWIGRLAIALPGNQTRRLDVTDIAPEAAVHSVKFLKRILT